MAEVKKIFCYRCIKNKNSLTVFDQNKIMLGKRKMIECLRGKTKQMRRITRPMDEHIIRKIIMMVLELRLYETEWLQNIKTMEMSYRRINCESVRIIYSTGDSAVFYKGYSVQRYRLPGDIRPRVGMRRHTNKKFLWIKNCCPNMYLENESDQRKISCKENGMYYWYDLYNEESFKGKFVKSRTKQYKFDRYLEDLDD